MKPNLVKLGVTSSTRKANVLNSQYKLGESLTLRRDCIKDLGIHIDCKLHFHHLVDVPFSHAIKLLILVNKVPFSFSTTDS
jgi:hypothetical protein